MLILLLSREYTADSYGRCMDLIRRTSISRILAHAHEHTHWVVDGQPAGRFRSLTFSGFLFEKKIKSLRRTNNPS